MTTIFVAKLDFGVSEEELKNAFEEFGSVRKVTVAKDRETNKPRGFAFVEMNNDEEAQTAIQELNGFAFNGRECVVKEAEDRKGNTKKSSNNFQRKDRQESFTKDSALPPVNDFQSPSVDESFPKKKKNIPKKKSSPKLEEKGSKKPKMDAYKKSSKDDIHFDDEEDIEEIDLFGKEEDIEVDEEDLSKYLVNDEDDWDDEDEWEDEDDWEDE